MKYYTQCRPTHYVFRYHPDLGMQGRSVDDRFGSWFQSSRRRDDTTLRRISPLEIALLSMSEYD